jgi:hypothetical protein
LRIQTLDPAIEVVSAERTLDPARRRLHDLDPVSYESQFGDEVFGFFAYRWIDLSARHEKDAIIDSGTRR